MFLIIIFCVKKYDTETLYINFSISYQYDVAEFMTELTKLYIYSHFILFLYIQFFIMSTVSSLFDANNIAWISSIIQ